MFPSFVILAKKILRNVGSCFCGTMKLQHRLKVIEVRGMSSVFEFQLKFPSDNQFLVNV